ncbi:UNVERIFIED_CONTAM: hypothetical protein K2H54_057581 [Gekko kuhli]
MEDEETLPYIEHFDKEVQDEMIVLDNLLLEQVRVKNQENVHAVVIVFSSFLPALATFDYDTKITDIDQMSENQVTSSPALELEM